MSKRIGKALLPDLKEKINKVEILPVEIEGEEFEIKVNMFLSTELRDRLIQNIQMFATEENVEKYSAELIAFYAIFKSITDIDFPEEIEEGMELFTGLSDLGIIAQIVEVVPEQMFNDITNALYKTQEILEQMVKENEVS